jgi:hypothetical protein
MKAKKVLRRLAKIDALISEVTDGCSECSVQTREALRYATSALVRVKKAVRSQVSSEKAKRARTKRRDTADKKAAATTPIPKTAKKSAPIKRAAQQVRAKGTPPTPVQTPTAHVA